MACIRHDLQLGVGPDLGQRPGGGDRRYDIIAAMDDEAGYALQLLACHTQQPAILIEKALVDEVMALDPGEGVGKVVFSETGRKRGRAVDGDGFTLPARPRLGGLDPGLVVATGQALVEGGQQIAALFRRDRRNMPRRIRPCTFWG